MNKILSLFAVLFFFSLNVYADLAYNFEDTTYCEIEMQIAKEIATDLEIYESQEIDLKVKNDVYCEDVLLVKKGANAKAQIETIITKGMNGFPAEIILGNFKIEGIEHSKLVDTYTKAGRNYAPLVFPLKWALTPIPFVGSLTNLILGGEARIKSKDSVTILYYPHWK